MEAVGVVGVVEVEVRAINLEAQTYSLGAKQIAC